MVTGRIFAIKRYALHDGPGIRTTVFLQGCALTCPWCHNPESRPEGPVAAYRPDRCLACGACTEICLQEVAPTPQAPWPANCERCGRCVTVCPTEARELSGRSIAAEDLLAEIERDRLFFEESGGGVTFSGGEPLAQPEFLLALLAGCRAREIPTAVDTSGHAAAEVIDAVAEQTGLWLFDLKHPDAATHRELTGVDNALILDNLERLASAGRRVWVRVPVIPDINDNVATIARIGALTRGFGLKRLHLLPYHDAAAAKRGRFDLDGVPPAPAPPTVSQPTAARQDLSRLVATLRGFGLEVILGG